MRLMAVDAMSKLVQLGLDQRPSLLTSLPVELPTMAWLTDLDTRSFRSWLLLRRLELGLAVCQVGLESSPFVVYQSW